MLATTGRELLAVGRIRRQSRGTGSRADVADFTTKSLRHGAITEMGFMHRRIVLGDHRRRSIAVTVGATDRAGLGEDRTVAASGVVGAGPGPGRGQTSAGITAHRSVAGPRSTVGMTINIVALRCAGVITRCELTVGRGNRVEGDIPKRPGNIATMTAGQGPGSIAVTGLAVLDASLADKVPLAGVGRQLGAGMGLVRRCCFVLVVPGVTEVVVVRGIDHIVGITAVLGIANRRPETVDAFVGGKSVTLATSGGVGVVGEAVSGLAMFMARVTGAHAGGQMLGVNLTDAAGGDTILDVAMTLFTVSVCCSVVIVRPDRAQGTAAGVIRKSDDGRSVRRLVPTHRHGVKASVRKDVGARGAIVVRMAAVAVKTTDRLLVGTLTVQFIFVAGLAQIGAKLAGAGDAVTNRAVFTQRAVSTEQLAVPCGHGQIVISSSSIDRSC